MAQVYSAEVGVCGAGCYESDTEGPEMENESDVTSERKEPHGRHERMKSKDDKKDNNDEYEEDEKYEEEESRWFICRCHGELRRGLSQTWDFWAKV